MASAAEQLAANMNFSAFGKATELKQRLWFTLGALLGTALGEPVSAIVLTLVSLLTAVVLSQLDDGYSLVQSHQSSGRFWLLQVLFAGGLVMVSGLLAAATIWLVRRRPA